MSSPVSAHLLLLGDAALVGIGVDGAGQRGAEAGEMRAAVALRDVVGEAQHRLVIGVGPLHRDFDGDAVALAADRDRRRVQRLLRAVEIFDEGLEPAFVMHAAPASARRRAHRSASSVTPELRKASSRSRCSSVAKSNSVLVKVAWLGRKVISVPVLCPALAAVGQQRRSPTTASGASGSPSRKRMNHSVPPRQMRSSSRSTAR